MHEVRRDLLYPLGMFIGVNPYPDAAGARGTYQAVILWQAFRAFEADYGDEIQNIRLFRPRTRNA